MARGLGSSHVHRNDHLLGLLLRCALGDCLRRGPAEAMINSRRKGANGERAFRDYLRERGIEARRGQQFSGSPDSPDVISSLSGVHWEVKRVERLEIHKAIEQAQRDAGDKLPVVAFKANRKDWLAILPMDKLMDLLGKENNEDQ